ncbi:bifunctional oligoribonuclease/PAP phosphatase NrnA [Mycoplasma sp. Mirounga ES2805-ORL]|uniref:DHH family phosphoesterase n=1 Tax=Mycoplasma sp. Mirounga ES2805-ORL TaxID=754514 RepID=UPI00197BB570|nr:bifunctional oligoribonuclease/PAP phosphatase NrnA [Mycoplasma sp. Mirounga ES2805-ORL]QSF13891.1 bifunctional oligoribonuclease/PAP phosphatase NrnA [Mycoplasma sp. Mirounga ES2805-ORL]
MKIGTYKDALKAIEEADNIIIYHHKRPDGDCLGSQAGLAEFIRTNYPKKNVFTPGNNMNIFNFMDYKYDNPNNINYKNSLGIVVDASSSDRIEGAEALVDNKHTKTLRIDHHPNDSDIKYDYLWVDEHYVAAAEMIAELAQKSNWKVNKKAAEHTFLGIITDSGRFLYEDTSSRTHQLASFLYEKGSIDAQKIFKELNKRTTVDIKYVGDILSNFKKSGRVLYYLVTKAKQAEYGFNDQYSAIFVNELANIEDNNCWAFFVELEDGKIRGRLRSNGPLVNEVARKYNGGGHANAAGCTLDSWDQVDDVLADLNLAIKKWEEK